MEILANITGIKYNPLLCRKMNKYNISQIDLAFNRDVSFILDVGDNYQIALSWWVSPKRTRSYPYARVYDSLKFYGKIVTIIPFMKDEGIEGDRDFLQWDTISLMSLLGIYVIICYYKSAEKSLRYMHKITNQKFDIQHIKEEIYNISSYQSDALHWNLMQIEKIYEIAQKALDSYKIISKTLGVKMHSEELARKRVDKIYKEKDSFMNHSRELAKKAQDRESNTIQPKEKLNGCKTTLTIKNFLGGHYFFTCDDVEIKNKKIYLAECKHSKMSAIPSLEDIKDGLLKMILFTNLKEVKIDTTEYIPVATLKLTTGKIFSITELRKSQIKILKLLKEESELNGFQVLINNVNLNNFL